MRNLARVIDRILKAVPEEDGTYAIRTGLASYLSRAALESPEVAVMGQADASWKDLHAHLSAYSHPITEPWEWTVWSIYTGLTVEELKEMTGGE